MATARSSTQTLDEAYFEWLYGQVRPQHSRQTYSELCWELYKKEFVPIFQNDDDRQEDGYDLLVEFLRERGLEVEMERVHGRGCSFLEMLIGLSRRLSFAAGGDAISWAWTLLGNLGCHSCTDPLTRHTRQYIDETLDRVIWRQYREDGVGGLFPLRYPQYDQRTVELWYQMHAYIEENPID